MFNDDTLFRSGDVDDDTKKRKNVEETGRTIILLLLLQRLLWECLAAGEGLLKSPAQHKTVRGIVCAHASVGLKMTRPMCVCIFAAHTCTQSPLSRCPLHTSSSRLLPMYQTRTIPFARPHAQRRNLFVMAHSSHAFTINGNTKYGPIFRHIYSRIAPSLCLLTVLSHDAHDAHDGLTVWNKSKRVLTVYYAIMTNSICVLLKETISSFV